MPDTVVARDSRREIERRAGIEPLDQLLAERHRLVAQGAELRARYGAFGSADNLRKIELSRIKQLLRATALRDGVKMTEAALDDAAHADPRYVEYITIATRERAEWSVLEDHIQAIEDRVTRDNTLARFATAELHL